MTIRRYVRMTAQGRIVQTLEATYIGAHPADTGLLAALSADDCTARVLADGEPLPDPVTQMWDGSAWVARPQPVEPPPSG